MLNDGGLQSSPFLCNGKCGTKWAGPRPPTPISRPASRRGVLILRLILAKRLLPSATAQIEAVEGKDGPHTAELFLNLPDKRDHEARLVSQLE